MGWELMNEPRCSGDFSASKLQHWIERSAEFLKSVDPNHLVTVCTEGFFGSSTPGGLPHSIKAAIPRHPLLPESCDQECSCSCLVQHICPLWRGRQRPELLSKVGHACRVPAGQPLRHAGRGLRLCAQSHAGEHRLCNGPPVARLLAERRAVQRGGRAALCAAVDQLACGLLREPGQAPGADRVWQEACGPTKGHLLPEGVRSKQIPAAKADIRYKKLNLRRT